MAGSLERLKEAMNHHAVYDEIAVSLVRPSDLAAAIAVIEAATMYRAAVQRDNEDGHYKAHLGLRYVEFVDALSRLNSDE